MFREGTEEILFCIPVGLRYQDIHICNRNCLQHMKTERLVQNGVRRKRFIVLKFFKAAFKAKAFECSLIIFSINFHDLAWVSLRLG